MIYRPSDEIEEPVQLRRLRWLVTGLTVVLIVGVLAIAATIVIRLGLGVGDVATRPVRAERFALPEGSEIVAVGRGAGTVMFVLRGPDGAELLHVYDDRTGAPAGESVIERTGAGG